MDGIGGSYPLDCYNYIPKTPHTGCPKKRTFKMLLLPTQSPVAYTPCVWKSIFGRFLLRLSLIKPSRVMFSRVKFNPTALNFGYGFVLLVYFFWDTLYICLNMWKIQYHKHSYLILASMPVVINLTFVIQFLLLKCLLR